MANGVQINLCYSTGVSQQPYLRIGGFFVVVVLPSCPH